MINVSSNLPILNEKKLENKKSHLSLNKQNLASLDRNFTPVNGFIIGQSLKSVALAKSVSFTSGITSIEHLFQPKNYGKRLDLTNLLKETIKHADFIKDGFLKHEIEIGNKVVKKLMVEVKNIQKDGIDFVQALVKKNDSAEHSAEILVNQSKLADLKQDIGIMPFNDKAGNLLVSNRSKQGIEIYQAGSSKPDGDVRIDLPGKKPESFLVPMPDYENIEKAKKIQFGTTKAFSASDKPYAGPNVVIVVKDGNAAEAHMVTIKDFFENPAKANLVNQIIESRSNGIKISEAQQKEVSELLKNSNIEILSGGLGSRSGADERILDSTNKFMSTSKALTNQPTGLSPIENVLTNLMMSGIDLNGAKVGEHIKFSIEPKGAGENLRSTLSAKFNRYIDTAKPTIILPNDGLTAINTQGAENVYVNALKMMKEKDMAGVIVLKEQTLDQVASKLGVVEFDEKTGQVFNMGEKLSKDELAKPENQGFKLANGNYCTSIFNTVMSDELYKAIDILKPFINKDGKADLNGRVMGPLSVICSKNTAAEMKQASPQWLKDIPDETLMHIKKDVLKDKKIGFVTIKEDWGDCGDIFDNMDFQRQIAKGEFKMSPYENYLTSQSMNPKTGVIAEDRHMLRSFEIANPNANGNIFVLTPTERPSLEVEKEVNTLFDTNFKKTNVDAHKEYDSLAIDTQKKPESKSSETKTEPKKTYTLSQNEKLGLALGGGFVAGGTTGYLIGKKSNKA